MTDRDSAGYIAPGSTSYHPLMMETSSGIELQRRWQGTALLHPMAVVGAGQLSNAYNYVSYLKNGVRTFHSEEDSKASYMIAGGGGELNVSSWMRIGLTVAYRKAGETSIPFRRGSSSGVATVMLFEFGRF